MSSQKQIDANRRNAQKSTGPRTDQGKARSRFNALKHGILARTVILDNGPHGESREEFDFVLQELIQELQPEGILESLLVEKIAVAYWRLQRPLRHENLALAQSYAEMEDLAERDAEWKPFINDGGIPDFRASHTIIRYEAMLERELYRALTRLERLQAPRKASAPPADQTPSPACTCKNTHTRRGDERSSQPTTPSSAGANPAPANSNAPNPALPPEPDPNPMPPEIARQIVELVCDSGGSLFTDDGEYAFPRPETEPTDSPEEKQPNEPNSPQPGEGPKLGNELESEVCCA